MREFIVTFAKDHGWRVRVDGAGNILCHRNRREIALQAHYDMVCVGRAPQIQLVRQGPFLMAREASLGADNGVGVAIMLALMAKGCEGEYLFTNDEEIGLVGAKHLGFELEAKGMVNLDSEEFGAIFVGAAGGVGLQGRLPIEYEEGGGPFWEVSFQGQGGHSGVDITKPIPNAIKELLHYLATQDLRIARIEGGERDNAIPAKARAIVAGEPQPAPGIAIAPAQPLPLIREDVEVLALLLAIPHGVREWDESLAIPAASQNLALVKSEAGELLVNISLRAMDREGLTRLERENSALLWGFGAVLKSLDRYPPWEPRIGKFAREIQKRYEAMVGHEVPFKAIHAGLESAIFAARFPEMEILSIGPQISNPHSTKERVRLDTIPPIYHLLEGLLCGDEAS